MEKTGSVALCAESFPTVCVCAMKHLAHCLGAIKSIINCIYWWSVQSSLQYPEAIGLPQLPWGEYSTGQYIFTGFERCMSVVSFSFSHTRTYKMPGYICEERGWDSKNVGSILGSDTGFLSRNWPFWGVRCPVNLWQTPLKGMSQRRSTWA